MSLTALNTLMRWGIVNIYDFVIIIIIVLCTELASSPDM